MSAVRLLLVLFLVVPIAEIWVLIEVGSVVGAVATIGLVVLTAVVGAALMRTQGLATLFRARDRDGKGEVPALELLEGAVILIAGAFLLTPGFITDAAGFACLIPSIRRRLVLATVNLRPAGLSRPHRHRSTGGGPWKGSTGARRTGIAATTGAADSFPAPAPPLDLSEVAPIISTRFE